MPFKDIFPSSFIKSECAWPDPEASTGVFKRMMGPNMCWTATGPALDAFARAEKDMGEYLKKYGESTSTTVLRTLWMIGTKKSSLRPTVVFSSSDQDARRKIQKAIQNSGILRREGFESINCNRPPDFPKLMMLTLEETEQAASGSPPIGRVILHTSNRGAQSVRLSVLSATDDLGASKAATGGGFLEWNRRYFLMTAAHAFQSSADEILFTDNSDCDFEFDFNGANFSDGDDDEMLNATSRGSKTPEGDAYGAQKSSPTDLSSSSGSLIGRGLSESTNRALDIDSPADLDADARSISPGLESWPSSINSQHSFQPADSSLYNEASATLEGPFTSSIAGPSPLLDYALIEVTASPAGLGDITLTQEIKDVPTLELKAIVGIKGTCDIIALTAGKGPIKGRLMAAPSFGIAPNSSMSQELWTIQLDGELEKGDCGCWVVDALNGTVYGHLIAGSPDTGTGLIVPLRHVLSDLFRKFGGDWRIASKSGDVPTPRLTSSPSDHTDKVPVYEESPLESVKESMNPMTTTCEIPSRDDTLEENEEFREPEYLGTYTSSFHLPAVLEDQDKPAEAKNDHDWEVNTYVGNWAPEAYQMYQPAIGGYEKAQSLEYSSDSSVSSSPSATKSTPSESEENGQDPPKEPSSIFSRPSATKQRPSKTGENRQDPPKEPSSVSSRPSATKHSPSKAGETRQDPPKEPSSIFSRPSATKQRPSRTGKNRQVPPKEPSSVSSRPSATKHSPSRIGKNRQKPPKGLSSNFSRLNSTKPSHLKSGGNRQNFSNEPSSDESDETLVDESIKHQQEPNAGNAPESGQYESTRTYPSFIIAIKEMTPEFDNGRPGPRTTVTSQWEPPKWKRDFIFGRNIFFRWTSGSVHAINSSSELGSNELLQHSVASMFSQEPRGHLLGVYADVSKEDIGGWRSLHFRHLRCPNVSESGYYSYLDFNEIEKEAAAPLSTHFVPQLLPNLYNPDNHRKNAGLIGKLPILIGIAAFSAASGGLKQVLTQCIKPRAWYRHNQANGRDSPLYRGIVVTICLDPKNPIGSTRDVLNHLQDGEYGPFYGP